MATQNRAVLLERAEQILDISTRDKRNLTQDELREHSILIAQIRQMDAAANGVVIPAQTARTGVPGQTELEARSSSHSFAGGLSTSWDSRSRTDGESLLPSFAEYRAQSVGTDTAGGYTVPTEQGRVLIDRLRAASVVFASNPRVFTMTSDLLRVPRIGASATVGMFAENADMTATDITFAGVTLNAKKLAGLVRASNEWLADSVPDARRIVEEDLTKELAMVLDNQFLAGSGSGANMTGILNQSGPTSTAIGGAITLDAIAEALDRLEADGATPSAIFVGPAVWGDIRRLKDADDRYQLQPDPTTDARRRLFGVPVYSTPYLSTSAIVADMSQVVIGVRDRVTLFYDPSRYAEYDQSLVRLTARFDIGILDPKGIEILTGIS